MRQAGKIAAAARQLAGEMVTAGVTTKQIDKAVHDFIISSGAVPTFFNYNGFPASICASVNEQVIHGIPNDRPLQEGDIVSVDVGATKDGYVGDCAATFVVGKGGREAERLIAVTKQSFFEGIKFAREGFRISDISHAIQSYVEANGFSVVREYVGHGIGTQMHEPPEVPNFGNPGHGVRIVRGMALAVEPMREAARHLLGYHDFSSLRAAECQARSPQRELTALRIARQGDFVVFEVTANAFLHHMVRNIVGALLPIGRGDRPPEWLGELLAGRKRELDVVTAPPDGLTFLGPRYPRGLGLPAWLECDDPL